MSQNFEDVINKLRNLDITNRKKGELFEKISKQLLNENNTSNSYKKISLWNEWEYRENENDDGIDIVIETHDNKFIAVQCKFFENNTIGFKNL
ncbi:DUF234 domain-containing protein, partial [Brachyspira hampsonii]